MHNSSSWLVKTSFKIKKGKFHERELMDDGLPTTDNLGL